MGKPSRSHVRLPVSEYIAHEEGTRGTETSQYPEEEKTTVIPLVVVSERGSSLNRQRVKLTGVALSGSWDHQWRSVSLRRSYQSRRQQNGMESPATDGKSPVRSVCRDFFDDTRVRRGPRNPV